VFLSTKLTVYARFSVCLSALVVIDISHFHGILITPLAITYGTSCMARAAGKNGEGNKKMDTPMLSFAE